MNAFHSTNLFCCFSRYQTPTNSVPPSFGILTTHNPQFLDSLRRRANARNVSFPVFHGGHIYIINSVDKTKLPSSRSFLHHLKHNRCDTWQLLQSFPKNPEHQRKFLECLLFGDQSDARQTDRQICLFGWSLIQ